MKAGAVGMILRVVAEYGILGMGWLLFFFAMFYIRVERARYQDLVIHIITYFTKIHMLRGDNNGSDITPFPPELLGRSGRSRRSQRRTGQIADPADDEFAGLRRD